MAVQEKDGAASFFVQLQPRAASDAIKGERDGALAVRLKAPPVDGAANAALLRFLSKKLGVPVSAIVLERGHRGRRKRVSVRGVTAASVRGLLVP